MIDPVPQAKALLPRIRSWCELDLDVRAELRAAGVSENRLWMLYPFDFDGYMAEAVLLLSKSETFLPPSSISAPAGESSAANSTAAIYDATSKRRLASAYDQLVAQLPARSPSPQTRRTPPFVFNQWVHTLLYIDCLSQQPHLYVAPWSIPGRQLRSLAQVVKDAEAYFKQHPA